MASAGSPPSRSVKSEVYAFVVLNGGSIDKAVKKAWGGERCIKLDRGVIESWAEKWSAKCREHVDFDDAAGSLGRKLLSLRSELRDVERRWPSLRNAEVCCAFEEITGLQRRTWQRARRATHEPQIAAITALLLDGRSKSAGGPYACAHEFVVELGGGKGLLSRVLASVNSRVRVVTVDRRAPAIGATFAEHDDEGEAGADAAGDAPRVTRVISDIREVDLVDVSRRFGQRSRSVTVVGKHLCADASDWAVECIARACGGRGEGVATDADAAAPELVSAVVLVPCCHPQLRTPAVDGSADGRAELDSGRLLARLSSCEHRLLCRLIEDAKLLRAQSSSSARKQANGGGPVARWLPLLRTLDAFEGVDDAHSTPSWEVHRSQLLGFGRIARRVIEEDRMRSLEDCGFVCTLAEIAPAALTPDNFAIVARRPGDGHTTPPTPPTIVPSGLVLLLSSRTHSALIRAAEFMLELRDAALRSPAPDKKLETPDEHALGRALHGAWVDNSLGVVILVGATAELERALQLRGTAAAKVLAPPLLQQTLRFSAFASSLDEIVRQATAAGQFPLRVRALPRSLERQLTMRICDGSCACEPCSHLSTSAPVALLEVTALDDTSLHTGAECGADGERAFAWALTPVAQRARARATPAHKPNTRPLPHHQLARRLDESAMRTLWVSDGGGSIGAVQAAATCAAFAGTCLAVADTVDRADAMAIWARATFPSAKRVVCLSGSTASVAECAGCLAGVVFCDAGRDFGDCIDMLLGLAAAQCIAAGARIWSTMRQPQRKGAAAQSRRDAALLRTLGDRLGGSYPRGVSAPDATQGGAPLPPDTAARFTCIEVHHQMSDRPWERTVKMCFGRNCAHVAVTRSVVAI